MTEPQAKYVTAQELDDANEMIGKGPRTFMTIRATFKLNGAPKGQRGLFQESWVFGKRPTGFVKLMAGFILRASEFYYSTVAREMSREDMCKELMLLAETIANLTTGNSKP